MLTVHCDGLCEPVNPGGTATYGWVIYRDGKKLAEDCNVVCSGPKATNNVAEYTAVIKALEYLLQQGLEKEKITLCSDSQLCIFQLQGRYSVRSSHIWPLHKKAKSLAGNFKNLEFRWISREKNKDADALSRQAYLKSLPVSEKAKELVSRVHVLEENLFLVPSQSQSGFFYQVDLENFTCTCKAYKKRKLICKHIQAAILYSQGDDAKRCSVCG